MSKEIYQAVLLEIERYARRKSKQPADLFNDDGDAGRWITIGSEDDGEGGKHGGHPVFVGKDGEMKTGHFAGKTMKEAFGKNETKDQPKPGIIEGSTKVANEDAQGGDQLGLFGEGDKAKKKGWKPSLDDDTKGHQQSLFDTSGDKDQLMMFDDGVTPEDRIGKVDQSEADSQSGDATGERITDLMNDGYQQFDTFGSEYTAEEAVQSHERRFPGTHFEAVTFEDGYHGVYGKKKDSGIEVEHVGGEDDGKKTELPFPSFAKDTQREQEELGGKVAKAKEQGWEWKQNRDGKHAWFDGDKQISGAFTGEGDGESKAEDALKSLASPWYGKIADPNPNNPPEKDANASLLEEGKKQWGHLSDDQISEMADRDEKAARGLQNDREFDGMGGRRSGPAMANQGAREAFESSRKARSYLKAKAEESNKAPTAKPTEQPAKDSKHDMSTLRGYTEFMKAVDKGEVSAEQLKAAHASFGENREALRDELSKMKKDDIVGWHHENDDGIQAFSYGADRKKKADLIEDKLGELESEFNKSSDSLSYNPFDGGSLADARRKAIGATTDEHLKAHAEKHAKAVEDRKQKREAFKDSLENPKTAHDWARKSRMAGGYSKLSQEEKAGYDDAMAAYRRENDPSKPQKPTEVKGFQPGQEATGDVGIVEGHHKKRDKPTWTVTVEQHLGDNWKDALSKAKSMGGNYVNARIARAYGATPGFQFFDKEAAENFKKVLGGESHDISDKVTSDAEARRQRQADSLLERAERIESRGEEKLNAPRKDNTARRARIARGMEDDARSEIAKAKTLRALAEHIEEGKSKNLNGVKAARHVEELDSMMHRAKSEAITAERKAKGNNWGYDAQERRYDSPAKAEDIEHAKFPYPQIWKMDMDNARTIMERTPGLKQLARKVGKWKKESLGQDFKQITDSKDIEAVQKALPKMRRHRDPQVRRLAEQLGNKFESYNRLHQMDIKSTPELRAALREYHALKQNPAGRDPIKEKLRDLKRDKTPGFFPTPSALSQRVVELAQIGEGHSVLEPSAGVGNLMDAVKDNHPDADMHGIEQKFDFADVLEMKGHKHEVGDFLKHDKQYDRIVMNPPFENRQDEKHVQHAYSLLKPGGRMVAITGSGAHTNERSAKFRDWLSEVGGKVIDLEAGQFMADDALKQTGVNTKLVVIEKPQESNKYSLRWEPTLTSERYSMSKWQPSLIGA